MRSYLMKYLKRAGKVSFYAVAAHEFGHSLGLSHSSVQGAIMFPYYQHLGDNYTLSSDDITGIQAIYGNYRFECINTHTHTHTWLRHIILTDFSFETFLFLFWNVTQAGNTAGVLRIRRWDPTSIQLSRICLLKRRDRPRNRLISRSGRRRPRRPRRPRRMTHPTHHWKMKNPIRVIRLTTPFPWSVVNYSSLRGRYCRSSIELNVDDWWWMCSPWMNLMYHFFLWCVQYFWRIGANGLQPDYPVKIDRFWSRLPANLTHIDAFYEKTSGSREMVIFIGKFNPSLSMFFERGLRKKKGKTEKKKKKNSKRWVENYPAIPTQCGM